MTQWIDDAGRRAVAKPGAIGRHEVQADAIRTDRVALENRAGVFVDRFGVAEDFDRFEVGDHACDLTIDPRNRRQLAGPVGFEMRPRDPGRAVRFPFGRHPPAWVMQYGRHQPM